MRFENFTLIALNKSQPPCMTKPGRIFYLESGGGALPYNAYLGMCHARDPHFQPFHKLQKIRSGASPFYFFFLPLRRSSFSKFLYLQAVHLRPRQGYYSQPERKRSVPETRIFTLELAPEAPMFTLDSLQSPPFPIFHFTVEHTYQKLGWVPPPPGLGIGIIAFFLY